MIARRLLLPVLAAAAALLAACSQPSIPEDNYYRLPGAPAAETGAPMLRGLLLVERPVADGLVAQRAIIHSEGDDDPDLLAYHYHFWSEPPPILLQNRLAAFLRAKRVAAQVVTPELRLEPDYVVSGKLRRFEQITGGSGRVVVEMELALKDMKGDRLVRQGSYRVTAPTADLRVSTAVRAMGKAVDEIFQRFLADLRAAKP